MDCNTDKVSSFRRKSIDIIKGSKEGYLFFETPDEKKSCTFYTRESTDCVLVSSKSKTRKIKGKLYEFRQTYTSISMEKLLEGKIFTNESVTFKVIARK
jgi:carbonic anhydrase